MKPDKIKPTPELAHLKSNDEKEFYTQVANFFLNQVLKYDGQRVCYFFSGDEGEFEFTGKYIIESNEQLEKFRQEIGRRDYHVHIKKCEGEQGVKFIFNGRFLLAIEIFKGHREVVHYEYDQYLRDIIEGKKQLPPRTTAFRDMIIGKALEQHAQATAGNKRKLAS